MSTQGARNWEAGTCHGKGTSFEVTSVLTAARPYNNLASLGFSILVRSVGVSVYTLRVVIRIHESRVLDESERMLVSIYGTCGPYTGDREDIND